MAARREDKRRGNRRKPIKKVLSALAFWKKKVADKQNGEESGKIVGEVKAVQKHLTETRVTGIVGMVDSTTADVRTVVNDVEKTGEESHQAVESTATDGNSLQLLIRKVGSKEAIAKEDANDTEPTPETKVRIVPMSVSPSSPSAPSLSTTDDVAPDSNKGSLSVDVSGSEDPKENIPETEEPPEDSKLKHVYSATDSAQNIDEMPTNSTTEMTSPANGDSIADSVVELVKYMSHREGRERGFEVLLDDFKDFLVSSSVREEEEGEEDLDDEMDAYSPRDGAPTVDQDDQARSVSSNLSRRLKSPFAPRHAPSPDVSKARSFTSQVSKRSTKSKLSTQSKESTMSRSTEALKTVEKASIKHSLSSAGSILSRKSVLSRLSRKSKSSSSQVQVDALTPTTVGASSSAKPDVSEEQPEVAQDRTTVSAGEEKKFDVAQERAIVAEAEEKPQVVDDGKSTDDTASEEKSTTIIDGKKAIDDVEEKKYEDLSVKEEAVDEVVAHENQEQMKESGVSEEKVLNPVATNEEKVLDPVDMNEEKVLNPVVTNEEAPVSIKDKSEVVDPKDVEETNAPVVETVASDKESVRDTSPGIPSCPSKTGSIKSRRSVRSIRSSRTSKTLVPTKATERVIRSAMSEGASPRASPIMFSKKVATTKATESAATESDTSNDVVAVEEPAKKTTEAVLEQASEPVDNEVSAVDAILKKNSEVSEKRGTDLASLAINAPAIKKVDSSVKQAAAESTATLMPAAASEATADKDESAVVGSKTTSAVAVASEQKKNSDDSASVVSSSHKVSDDKSVSSKQSNRSKSSKKSIASRLSLRSRSSRKSTKSSASKSSTAQLGVVQSPKEQEEAMEARESTNEVKPEDVTHEETRDVLENVVTQKETISLCMDGLKEKTKDTASSVGEKTSEVCISAVKRPGTPIGKTSTVSLGNLLPTNTKDLVPTVAKKAETAIMKPLLPVGAGIQQAAE